MKKGNNIGSVDQIARLKEQRALQKCEPAPAVGEDTALYGLYGDVPLGRVGFLAPLP